jgi:hypothetical protein
VRVGQGSTPPRLNDSTAAAVILEAAIAVEHRPLQIESTPMLVPRTCDQIERTALDR